MLKIILDRSMLVKMIDFLKLKKENCISVLILL